MNIQELRLGNAVSVKVWDDLNPLFTVTEIGYDVLWVSNSGGNVSTPVSPGLVEGIPISKDAVKNLEGFVFDEPDELFYYYLDGISIEVDGNVVFVNIDLPDGVFNKVLPNITQIHQLQNLIYDLNGGVMLEYNTNAK